MTRRFGSFALTAFALALCGALLSPLGADTIFLKNGEFIDGIVSRKTDSFVELQIGDIGKVDIPRDEIYSIEKNTRTGVHAGAKGATDDEKNRQVVREIKEDLKGGKPGAKPEESPPGKEATPVRETSEPRSGEPDPDADSDAPPSTPAKKLDPELEERIAKLIRDLERDRSRNRTQAERHLAAIGPPALPALLKLTGSANDLTRIAVLRLFHEFGDEQVIDACIASLLDDNEFVREYANKTLKRVTGEDFKYQPNASPRRRESAQAKWRDWWKADQEQVEKDRKLSGR